jgi:hypothetical protein
MSKNQQEQMQFPTGSGAGGPAAARRRIGRIVVWAGLLILLGGFAAVWVSIPNPVPAETVQEILEQFEQASKVELIPCQPNPADMTQRPMMSENLSVVLSAEEIEELKELFERSQFLHKRIRRIRCWIPHHAIRLTRADGSDYLIQICFQCRNLVANDFPILQLPGHWEDGLRDWFAKKGLTDHL